MTQKDFVAIAAVLKEMRPIDPQGDMYFAWCGVVHALADMCHANNPKFDRQKFFKAATYWR